MTEVAETVLRAVREVVGEGPEGLHEPFFNGREIDYLRECVESTYVSSNGRFIERFEDMLHEFTGAKHVVATASGTSALHTALMVAGVRPGDEVLVPTLSFVATANAVTYAGAVPHFVESEELTLGVDPLALRNWLSRIGSFQSGYLVNRMTGRRISCLVPMHTFGHPCQIAELVEVANEFGLVVVEDAAESLGSWYEGQHTGTFGKVGIFSFNGNKTITTGGGGAIVTNDLGVAERARHLTTTAKVAHVWNYVHDEVGFNYRLPNLNAALGCSQMEILPELLDAQRRRAEGYRKAFIGFRQGYVFTEPKGAKSNYWLQTLVLQNSYSTAAPDILELLNGSGFASRPAWHPLHLLSPYRRSPRAPLQIATNLATRIINLPSSVQIA